MLSGLMNHRSLGARVVSYAPGAFMVLMDEMIAYILVVAHLVEIGSSSSL